MVGRSSRFARSGRGYITTDQIAWQIGAPKSGLWLVVPQGFRFDVSIPRWLHWILSPHDPRYLIAAALHDYAIHELGWGRVTAAAPFSEALKAENLGRLHRLAMVLAVIVHRWD